MAVLDKDGKLINWVFPNGEDATDIVRDDVGIDTDGEKFSLGSLFGFLNRLFGGVGGIWGILAIVGAVLLLIFCFPLVMQFLKFLLRVITAPFKWLAKKFGGKGKK